VNARTTVETSAARVRWARAIGCAVVIGLSDFVAATPAFAYGIPCAAVTAQQLTGDLSKAVAVADAVFSARWGKVVTGWGAAFKFKTPPRNPFALKTDTPDPSDLPPISGLIAAQSIACLVYEVHTPRAFVVRYSANGLRFNENAAGWTPPLPSITIMLLAVEPRDGAWAATDVPEGRTAIPPFSMLRRPTEAELPEVTKGLSVPAKRAVATKRR
jgi:hypothetical protein